MKTNQFLKRLLFVIIAVMFFSVINNISVAQEKKYSKKDIPQTVLESFKKLYPNAVMIGYDIENHNGNVTYEIESKDGNIQRDVEFTTEGNIIEIGESIDVNSLPGSIVNSINAKFGDAKILEAEKKIRGSEILYEIKINDKNKKREVLLGSNGNIIKDNEEDGEGEDKGDKD